MTWAEYLKMIIDNPKKTDGQKYMEIIKIVNQACKEKEKNNKK